MSELKQFRLPDVGEGLTEADIVKWHVQPGDRVTVNQIIVEIETAKAVVELPSPYEGVVAGLLVPEGTTADVGTPIISVETGEDAGAGGRPPVAGARSDDLIPRPPAEGGTEPGIEGTLAPKDERGAPVRARRLRGQAGPDHPACQEGSGRRRGGQGGQPGGQPSGGQHGGGQSRLARLHRPAPDGQAAPDGQGGAGRRCGAGRAGQAARPQAGQGPGHRPVGAGRHRPGRLDHPRGCAGAPRAARTRPRPPPSRPR